MGLKKIGSGVIEYVVYEVVSHWKGWAVAIGVLLLIGMANQPEPKKDQKSTTTPIHYEQPR